MDAFSWDPTALLADPMTLFGGVYSWWAGSGFMVRSGTTMIGLWALLNHTDMGTSFLYWLEKTLAASLMSHLRQPGHWTYDGYFYSRRSRQQGAKPVRQDEGAEAPPLIPADY
eukprot:TRINITY_DN23513_c0_g1_i1.p2 TRINITY_DN23513_c0_g1~~TRINITY_DN23513_c0_g1_i1.p2  ORF type:complete len:113 (+),score=31.65 TRINITY_DN23513_c0_g1_i1:80-418(+)